MANEISSQEVYFFSGGQRIVGDLFLPGGPAPKNGFPAVIVAHGYGGIRKTTTPETARSYARAGYASIIFDYRGFGDSGGERWLLLPQNEVDDVRSAVTFLASHDRINQNRIAIHGCSFGGAVAVAAAAVDERIRCAICSVGLGNGRRWLKSLRRNWEWIEFEREVAEDRVTRMRTGVSRKVDPYHIMISDPFAEALHVELNAKFPERKFELPLQSAEAIFEFVPEEDIARAPPKPGLIISVKDDYLVPDSESRHIYDAWPGEKKLVVVEGYRHHDVYGAALSIIMGETLPWLEKHLIAE